MVPRLSDKDAVVTGCHHNLAMDTAKELPHIRGLDLRSLLVLILLRQGRPMVVAELVAAVTASGFALAGRPGKAVSDALRWEMGLGRVRREGRATYCPGYVAKVTRHRMRSRVAQTRNQGGTPSYATRTPRGRPGGPRASPPLAPAGRGHSVGPWISTELEHS